MRKISGRIENFFQFIEKNSEFCCASLCLFCYKINKSPLTPKDVQYTVNYFYGSNQVCRSDWTNPTTLQGDYRILPFQLEQTFPSQELFKVIQQEKKHLFLFLSTFLLLRNSTAWQKTMWVTILQGWDGPGASGMPSKQSAMELHLSSSTSTWCCSLHLHIWATQSSLCFDSKVT